MTQRGVAVVTGAAGGLGRAFCERLTARGYAVVGADLAGADERLDVTDPQACRELARRVQPDVWVNNAGVLGAGSVAEQPDAEIERVVAVNLLGVVHGSRAAVEVMRARGSGHILNVGSLASWVPVPGEVIYAATKHAVRAFTVGLAAELRGTGIRVSLLCPDGIWTPMLHDRLADPAASLSFSGRRLLNADEVAARGVALIERGSGVLTIGSLPRSRAVLCRLLGSVPELSLRLFPVFDALGRRNQRRLRVGR
ncbi:hypothetical protein TH66_03155 [Carbonactinospora thermoautotrophica]|uniref:Ketoreductase domain-containing protein n=1 Tax=Carbonactinospora thermoautotrophica TaxID=1469144 RepID=A0A132NBR8_9ACTN|nr:SDR family oxidoreductase [Carbonactinospora thermoautotrophica]KWX05266.1 hypothetical protein TH66_03155 [Carbonactinospora thermoautotrophica]KWX07609.1 hypothetical protein TR74_18200 [Carbonactinospora thermoautotrophica]